MECDPTRVCELLVGLGDVEIVGVDDEAAGSSHQRPCCAGTDAESPATGPNPRARVWVPMS